jgi:hypothetical protein
MPRTIQEILDHADELASRFERHEPGEVRDATDLAIVREAVLDRAATERVLMDAVAEARLKGHSWASIGAMVGTSGEAARQRYGNPSRASRPNRDTGQAVLSGTASIAAPTNHSSRR